MCGWLAGEGERVELVYPVPNAAADPRTGFRMDPEAQLRAMREIRDSGLAITGTYHSHPRTPAYPSRRDLSLSLYPEALHVIVSLANPRPDVRCYRITAHNLSAVELAILPKEVTASSETPAHG